MINNNNNNYNLNSNPDPDQNQNPNPIQEDSFIIIMETLTSDDIISNAIKKINKEETLYYYVINIYYKLIINIFSLIQINGLINCLLYWRSFSIKNVIISFED